VVEQQNEAGFDPRTILWIIRRHGWLLLLPIVVSICAGSIYLSHAVPQYESFVVVGVSDRVAVSGALEPLVRGSQRDQGNPREMVALLDTKVHGRAFLTELVERLGYRNDPEMRAAAREAVMRNGNLTVDEYIVRTGISSLSKKIHVASVQGRYIRIAATDPSPQRARQLAGMIADVITEQSKQSSLEKVQARGDFSQDQMVVYEERLRKAEEALRSYQTSMIRTRLVNNPVDQSSIGAARLHINQTDEEIAQVRDRLRASTEQLQTAGVSSSAIELGGPRTEALTSRLEELEASYGVASIRGGADGRTELTEVSGKVAGVRQALLAEFETMAASVSGIPPSARETVAGIGVDRAILRSLRTKRERLVGLVNSFLAGAQNTPTEEMMLRRLQGEVQTNQELIATLRREATSSRITEALETSALGMNLDILEAPQLPIAPVWPSPIKILAIAFAMGPLASVGIVLLTEKSAVTVRTVEQAEAELGQRVIGTVPRVQGWIRPGSFLSRNWAALSIVLVILLTGLYYTLKATSEGGRPPAAGAVSTKASG
jgi:uncharacterized protein involved in exopolysaccharide biosynthesis